MIRVSPNNRKRTVRVSIRARLPLLGADIHGINEHITIGMVLLSCSRLRRSEAGNVDRNKLLERDDNDGRIPQYLYHSMIQCRTKLDLLLTLRNLEIIFFYIIKMNMLITSELNS